MNRSVREGKKCKALWAVGLDTALYKNYLLRAKRTVHCVTKCVQQCRFDGFIQFEYEQCMIVYSAVATPLHRWKLFTPVHSDTSSTSLGSILAKQQLRAKMYYSLTFPPLSIARYSFIQLSGLRTSWRERTCPNFETVANGGFEPGLSRLRDFQMYCAVQWKYSKSPGHHSYISLLAEFCLARR